MFMFTTTTYTFRRLGDRSSEAACCPGRALAKASCCSATAPTCPCAFGAQLQEHHDNKNRDKNKHNIKIKNERDKNKNKDKNNGKDKNSSKKEKRDTYLLIQSVTRGTTTAVLEDMYVRVLDSSRNGTCILQYRYDTLLEGKTNFI